MNVTQALADQRLCWARNISQSCLLERILQMFTASFLFTQFDIRLKNPLNYFVWLSGEARDTAELGYMVSMLINAHFTRAQRVELFRSWGASSALLPVGGNEVWGNQTWAPDDPDHLIQAGKTHGYFSSAWRRLGLYSIILLWLSNLAILIMLPCETALDRDAWHCSSQSRQAMEGP